MPPSDSFAPIDNDSKDYLDDVKKKKARYFALIVKGADIRKLIVAKKPIKTAQITAAKAEGAKGDAYLGVCSGGGQEITFEIVTQDGEGKDPCKISKLRQVSRRACRLEGEACIQVCSGRWFVLGRRRRQSQRAADVDRDRPGDE
ncbi:MAG: hypothetical protein QM775_10945 [Pirellulales bacterium]